MRRLLPEEIKKRIETITNNEYETDGIVGEDHKVNITHKKCGYTWRVKPKSIFLGISHCPACGGHNIMTYKKLLKLLDDDGLEFCGIPKNSYAIRKDCILVKCKKCGKQHKFLINNIKNRLNKNIIYCPSCVSEKNKQKWEMSNNKTKLGIEKAKENFDIISTAKKDGILYLTVKCQKCGKIS